MSNRVFVIKGENRFKLDPEFVSQYIGQQPNWGYGVLSYVTYKRTYARPISKEQLSREAQLYLGMSEESANAYVKKSEQTSEEYWQTLVRVVEGVSSILKQQVKETGQTFSDAEEQVHAQKMFKYMWEFKFTPPGRGLWMMGAESMEIKGGAALNNCAFISTENIDKDFTLPFCDLMDFSMLGVGVGFDLAGAGKVSFVKPHMSDDTFIVSDTREAWINCVRVILNAYIGAGPMPKRWDYSLIRKEGMPLKTFGGTASGYAPLAQLIKSLTELLNANIGKKISGTVITDIMNFIGKCVVAGNVRRSSEIALGDPNDADFIALKDNSELVAWREEQTKIAKASEAWKMLQARIVKHRRRQRAHSVLSADYAKYQDAIDKLEARQRRVLAANEQWKALEDKINNHPLYTHRWASNNSAFCKVKHTDYKALAKLTVSNGEPGYVWPEVFRAYGRLADPKNYKDKLAKGTNPCHPSWVNLLTPSGIRTLENLNIGDTIWTGKRWTIITNKVETGIKPVFEYTTQCGRFIGTENHRVLSNGVKTEVKDVLTIDTSNVKPNLSEAFVKELLPNLNLFTRGENDKLVYQGRLKNRLQELQIKLSALGIVTKLKSYEPNFNKMDMDWSWLEVADDKSFNNLVSYLPDHKATYESIIGRLPISGKVTLKEYLGDFPVYDITVADEEHVYWCDGHIVSNCGEQTLFDGELCCLVETYPTKCDSLEEFKEVLKYAYRYAKAVTLVPTHNPRTNAVMVRNRRIGTSMAGIIELYSRLGMQECIRWWNDGYETVCHWDSEYSRWLGVNESIKKTSLKPGGTTPLLVGVEGGMKAPNADYYIRTIRIDHISPLVDALKQSGYRVEPDRTTPRTVVVYFPTKNKEGVRTGDKISLWEQACLFTNIQKYWSDNMVSATLTFQPHEAGDIANILTMFEGQWKAVSFLPYSNHGFIQAPYIPCTKEEYEVMMAKIKPLKLEGLEVSHDAEDKFCSGGICEVKTPGVE